MAIQLILWSLKIVSSLAFSATIGSKLAYFYTILIDDEENDLKNGIWLKNAESAVFCQNMDL